MAIIYFSHKHQFFLDDSSHDKPQNYHEESTPRAGGIGIISGMLLLLLSPFGLKLILPIILAFMSGIFEDYHNSLSPRRRLALQITAALSAIWLTDAVVTYLGLGISMPYWMGVIFSTFAIVGMMNAINIIDGFNGLASGIIILILLSFSTTAYTQENIALFNIILITLGSTVGFFLLNFPKGKIFLGDGGAYMLGFIVAILGIFLASNYESVSPWYVLAIFIYPVWEVLFSIIRKLYIGLSPMQPDSNHFHMLVYRQITHSNPLTAFFILVMCIPFMSVSTLYYDRSILNIILACSFITLYMSLYFYLYRKDLAQ
ncbi:MAG: undecaprenyl/decaprenyl-phosphate alpha-N-acetylglucosaminyl 1-phosphate transferase [Sulfurovum sp.]|nr:undecaprenyl/decaprenyl-phosphate alpha-N-acetylglucosaminyl 1-phosphate transferase [Sulfurovum sp.]